MGTLQKAVMKWLLDRLVPNSWMTSLRSQSFRCFYCCLIAFVKLGRNPSCHHTGNLSTSCNKGNNDQQMLSNLLKPSAPFFGIVFQQNFSNSLSPLVWLLACILSQMDSLKGGNMLMDQACWEKDRENSWKPYKSPPPKIQWETSALKLEEGWETFGPGVAYNPQFNSSCYYWITLRCHLKYWHPLKATETGKCFEWTIAISESSRGILLERIILYFWH